MVAIVQRYHRQAGRGERRLLKGDRPQFWSPGLGRRLPLLLGLLLGLCGQRLRGGPALLLR
jgi:hypothetical protein